jgi:hypothetical protein
VEPNNASTDDPPVLGLILIALGYNVVLSYVCIVSLVRDDHVNVCSLATSSIEKPTPCALAKTELIGGLDASNDIEDEDNLKLSLNDPA